MACFKGGLYAAKHNNATNARAAQRDPRTPPQNLATPTGCLEKLYCATCDAPFKQNVSRQTDSLGDCSRTPMVCELCSLS